MIAKSQWMSVLSVLWVALWVLPAGAQDTALPESTMVSPVLANMNASLRKAGITNIGIERAELLENQSGATPMALTLLANNRTHLLSSQFVERDARRGGRPYVTYLTDQSGGRVAAWTPDGFEVLENAVTEPVLDAAMARWQNDTNCNGPAAVKIADDGHDPDITDGLVIDPQYLGTPVADITHAGWVPPGFFDVVAGTTQHSIVAMTFTYIFYDANGDPTDVDHDGRSDVAFREIYYNAGWLWSEGPIRPYGIDIASVATHEAGHAFGLGHFGKEFIDQNGQLKFAPFAVMNAVNVFPVPGLTGTDRASFCQAWARQP
jgi:hypothetical protein